MCTKLCRTCRYWGNNPEFSRIVPGVIADCYYSLRTYAHHTCFLWQQRQCQELGSGVLPFWFQQPEYDWKLSASILHDLRYDSIAPGESTKAADDEWLENCLLLAGSDKTKRAVAYAGYAIIRAYGVLRGLR